MLGGLDRLVFTGGIGAKAPAIRTRICASLKHLGIALDTGRNTNGARVVSADASPIAVEALATDEELTIARHVQQILSAQAVPREA